MEKSKPILINELSSVNGLCYVCLTKSKKMHILNSKVRPNVEQELLTIWHLLIRAISTEISYDYRHPSYICPMCLSLLKISYKFKKQLERSQKLLKEYFGENVQEKSTVEWINDESELSNATVELISKQGTYNLEDVFIVENFPEDKPDFSGFLKNLGTEVTATFTHQDTHIPKLKASEPLTIMKLDDNDGEQTAALSNRETTKLDNDMDEADKKINRNITKCFTCNKVFANKKYLNRHVQRLHITFKNSTFVCEICGACLKSRSSHYHHMMKHVGKRYTCNICHKTYHNANNLQQHVMSRHTKERPHLCTVCGKTFSYTNALDYHMRTHTGERKYKCSYCDRTFTMKCGLNRHIRTHTGHRPYKCSFCDKAFRSKGEVNCHEMIHTGYRPYHCSYCNKGFTKTFNLKLHLMGHSGNHQCAMCPKTFIDVKYLSLHIQSNHGYVDP